MGSHKLDTDETAYLIRSAADQIEGSGMTPNAVRDQSGPVANSIELVGGDGEDVPRSTLESAQMILRLGALTAEMYVDPHVSPSLYRDRADEIGVIIYGAWPPNDNPTIKHETPEEDD